MHLYISHELLKEKRYKIYPVYKLQTGKMILNIRSVLKQNKILIKFLTLKKNVLEIVCEDRMQFGKKDWKLNCFLLKMLSFFHHIALIVFNGL